MAGWFLCRWFNFMLHCRESEPKEQGGTPLRWWACISLLNGWPFFSVSTEHCYPSRDKGWTRDSDASHLCKAVNSLLSTPQVPATALWSRFANLAQTTESAQHSHCWQHWRGSVMRSTGRRQIPRWHPGFPTSAHCCLLEGKVLHSTQQQQYAALSYQKQLGLWSIPCCPIGR